MDKEEINCFVDENEVRCEVDGRDVEMNDEHIERVEDSLGSRASPDACADLNEAFLEEFVPEESLGPRRQAMGQALFISGCPVPNIEPTDPEE